MKIDYFWIFWIFELYGHNSFLKDFHIIWTIHLLRLDTVLKSNKTLQFHPVGSVWFVRLVRPVLLVLLVCSVWLVWLTADKLCDRRGKRPTKKYSGVFIEKLNSSLRAFSDLTFSEFVFFYLRMLAIVIVAAALSMVAVFEGCSTRGGASFIVSNISPVFAKSKRGGRVCPGILKKSSRSTGFRRSGDISPPPDNRSK